MNCEEYKKYCLGKFINKKEAALKQVEPKILAISSMAKPYLDEEGNIWCEICGFNFIFYDSDKHPFLVSYNPFCHIFDEVDLGKFFEK